jgi:hypothetical protein
MADVSNRGTNPWIAFLAGAVAVLAVVLIVFGWSRGERAAVGLRFALRDAPTLPAVPRMPDAPRLPDAPVPHPK